MGLVSPYAWSSRWGVNRHIAALSEVLTRAGHDVSIIAPAGQGSSTRASRKQARASRREAAVKPDAKSYSVTSLKTSAGGTIRLLKISGTVRFPYSENLANLALPIEVTQQLDNLLAGERFDILHIHEPFPPSLSFTALRMAQCPVVATFHTGGERFLSYQLMRSVVERAFQRLDARICASQNTRRIISSYFPGDYEVIGAGVDTGVFNPPEGPPTWAGAGVGDSAGRVAVFAAWSDARKGMALLSRTIRLLPHDVPPFELKVVGGDELSWRANLIVPRRLRQTVTFSEPAAGDSLKEIYQRAGVLLAPYATSGQATAIMEAMACGAGIIVPGQGGLKELVTEGSEGLLLEHPYAYNLAAGLVDLLFDDKLMASLGDAAARKAARGSWDKVFTKIERNYQNAYRRRRRAASSHGAIESALGEETILADLHMHTSYSSDCKTTPAELLAACEESGLKTIAITDHNTIEGALEVAKLAPRGIQVIIGEEIKTTRGEIIGLFLSEEIPKGLSLDETIARIKGQKGLVYVPHPFDPLHKTPTYETLARNAADIDIVEVYNPRITFTSFNQRAQRLALKYDIPGAAGSDCHVVEGIGTAMISLRLFKGPGELLVSLREADIIRSKVSPIILHSLKLLKSGRSASGSKK